MHNTIICKLKILPISKLNLVWFRNFSTFPELIKETPPPDDPAQKMWEPQVQRGQVKPLPLGNHRAQDVTCAGSVPVRHLSLSQPRFTL